MARSRIFYNPMTFLFIVKKNRNESTRPLFKKEKTLAIKGDLLRASQICMVLDTSMSDTVKKIKSGYHL